MIIQITKVKREKFIREMRPEINSLPTNDEYHKKLGLLCSKMVESVSKSNFKNKD